MPPSQPDDPARPAPIALDRAAPPPPGVNRKAVYTLMLINFIDLMGFGLVVLLLPFYAKQFDASTLQIGLLLATFSLCQFFGSPILGAWSDRVGRRPVLIFSQWGSVLGYLVLAFAMWHDWSTVGAGVGLAVVFLSRAIDGFTAGNVTVTNAYVADVIPAKDRAGIIGLLGAAFGLGFAFGPPIGGLLFDYHPAFPGLLSATLSAVASIMVWRWLPESHTNRTSTGAGGFAFSAERRAAVRGQPMVLALTMIWFLSMLAYVMLEPTVPLILDDWLGYTTRQAGFFFGAVGLVIIFVQGGLVRPLNKRLGEWPIAVGGTVIGAIGLLIYAQASRNAAPTIQILAVAAILNATGRSLQTPTLSALVSQNADPRTMGAAYGIYQGTASLGRVIGPVLGSLLFDRHPAIMFLVGAGLLAASGFVLVGARGRLVTSRGRAEDPSAPPGPVARASAETSGA